MTRILERWFGFKVDDSEGVPIVVGRTGEVKEKLDEINSNSKLVGRLMRIATSEQ